MLKKSFKCLKSGTDIRGIALKTPEGEPINLTDEVVTKIAYGFAFWLQNKLNLPYENITVSVGHDSRLSATRLKNSLIKALVQTGIKVFDCALCSTPAMFMTTVNFNCNAAIEITASHHPFNKNGFKFFTKDGGLDSADIDDILKYAESNVVINKVSTEQVKKVDYMKIYSKRLREIICKAVNAQDYEKPLLGCKIVVDAGNGAGGFFATDVLLPLGADISGSQFLEPDGHFSNHIPNPEDKLAISMAASATLEQKADLGIVFDTDVDRVGAISQTGQEINKNKLIALAAKIALEDNPGGTIVTDSVTSNGLKKYIEETLGGVQDRFKRGYKNVINEAIKLNNVGVNCPLAMETSGHAAMRENYFLDDGAYLITKIIILMVKLKQQGKTIDDALIGFTDALESDCYRLNINGENFKELGNEVINKIAEYVKTKPGWKVEKDNKEGIRVSVKEANGFGWFLLRVSIHDPVMVLNIESDTPGGVLTIKEDLSGFLKKFTFLQIM